MIKRLLILLLLFGLFFAIGVLTHDQAIWRLEFISQRYHIGINLALLLAGVFAALAILYLLTSLLRWPLRWLSGLESRKEKQSFNLFRRGLILCGQGHWRQAAKLMSRVGRCPAYQFHANLLLVYCHLQQQQIDDAYVALNRAREATDKDDFALTLAETKILIAEKQSDQAQVLLKRLIHQQPKNSYIKELLAENSTSADKQ